MPLVNVNGGAIIALGIPLAPAVEFWFHWCTKWLKRDARKGLATLCIGGVRVVL
ncbi:hypothetical protein KCP69_07615 [Salmonella enterica subsp. enterica]|nr:hypothetical protein KCP69_07615 [Salmonella enterica subsp. enterica]